MNIRNEIPNPNQLSSNISVYPNPPSHYKRFGDSIQAMNPPDLSIFSKINTFGCLGFEYKINNYNFYSIDLDPNIKINDLKFVQDKQIPNVDLFNENTETIKNKISKMTIIEQVNVIKEEVKFLNRIFADLTKKLNFNFRDCEINNKLMKFSFQKIYFVISIIKKKQVKYIFKLKCFFYFWNF